ncbi:hypothetical protein BDV3_001777 [Batrachochytrium dendrobatidis]|nr:hypothetical protein O5D80_007641 [Batrachochytrium dendrobatidis]
MEKYSGWRDPGTGIHPFLSPKPPRSDESTLHFVLYGIKTFILGPFLATIKIILIAVVALLWSILDLVSIILISPKIQYTWKRIVYGSLGRTVLALCGFWWISKSNSTLQRGGRKSGLSRANHKLKKPNPDLYISNHTSYFDILYYASSISPVFLHISSNGMVRQISFWEALMEAGNYPDLDDEPDKVTFVDFIKKYNKSSCVAPIVIFPEGTTSNGRGLLKFMNVFKDMNPDELDIQIHVTGIKYVYNQWCPCYTVGNKYIHFFWTLAQLYNTLEVRELPPQELDLSSNPSAVDTADAEEDAVGLQFSTILARILRIRKTSKSVVDKCEFLSFYRERESRRYKRKK